jgi:signal transduction histidine kinase
MPRFDPRLHLAAAIGWAVFAIVALAALTAATLASEEAERHIRADTEKILTQFANQIRYGLATNLENRRSIVRATAAQIVASDDRGADALRHHLEAVQAQFPEFVWLGVADDAGRVMAATGGILHGETVAQQPWFQQGRQRPFLGESHGAPLLKKPPRAPGGWPPRFVDVAAPITGVESRRVGVLGAYLSWDWIERLQAELLGALDTHRPLDLLLVAGDGTILIGPAPWVDRKRVADVDVTEGGTFLVGRHAENTEHDAGLGWNVLVRQGVESALGPARKTRQTVFLVVLLAGLASAVVAVWATRLLTRRLAVLAEEARAVRRGARRTLTVPAGADEVSHIGAALAETIQHLQQEKQALTTLNAELDARVAERTARIRRLADEARQAAVTRERLRLARDLHDTLAHSLMALLTQIRLMRKLRVRLDAAELDAELGRAEEVAATGLAEARAAITQMRHNSARDIGLGPALQELLARFSGRSGIVASLDADPQTAGLADERVETVFRIVEEALRNVERHARAHSVRVRLEKIVSLENGASDLAGRVCVEIVDDGVGFDPTTPRPGHYGLRGIQEQAALIGAQLGVHSRPGEGTRIVLEFDA